MFHIESKRKEHRFFLWTFVEYMKQRHRHFSELDAFLTWTFKCCEDGKSGVRKMTKCNKACNSFNGLVLLKKSSNADVLSFQMIVTTCNTF